MSARTAPETGGPRRNRRRALLAGVLALLVVAAAAGWFVLRPAGDDGPGAAAATPTAETTHGDPGTYGTSVLPSTSAQPTDVPQTVLAGVPGLPTALAPVSLDQPAESGDGVSARLVDIKAITAQGQGLGEKSGAALAVVIELSNTGSAPVSLDTVAVNMYLGADGAPAARLQGDSGMPFNGSLAPGASAQAVYAFTVPAERRDLVTVTVSHAPDSGTAVFSGSVS